MPKREENAEPRMQNVCPLLTIAAHRQHKCVRSRCAYWNRLYKKCSVTVIGDCLCVTEVVTTEYDDFYPDLEAGDLPSMGEGS